MSDGTFNYFEIITIALSEYLPESKVQAAIQVWKNEFERDKPFAYNEFIALICDTPELNKMRNKLYSSFVRAIAVANQTNGAKPSVSNEVANSAPSSGDKNKEVFVFEYFIRKVFELMSKTDNAYCNELRVLLGKNFKNSNLDRDSAIELSKFMNSGAETLSCELTVDQLKGIVHDIYVKSCEYYGPVQSDKIFSVACSQTELIPEAFSFSPKKLL